MPDAIRPGPAACVLTLALVVLWTVTHRYKGIAGDAELYAVQAMSRIYPGLSHDIFLQNNSQDQYTIFSPFYAWCIRLMGLRDAARILSLTFKIWFFAAAWSLASSWSNRVTAFVAVALLMLIVGSYGAFNVFRYAEDWVTARSLAEALCVSAIAFHCHGMRKIALAIIGLAFLVHPILALPVLLVLICLWTSLRRALAATLAAVSVILGISLLAQHVQSSTGLLTVLDAPWLDVVRERSIFLFPQLWPAGDWNNTLCPFLSLALTVLAVRDTRLRNLAIASMLVGAAGLIIALIAGTIGHVAILIQGQAWRWMWITRFLAVLLLAYTASTIYEERRGGPMIAILLLAGWIFTPVQGSACIALALVLWLLRERIQDRAAIYLRWAAGALVIIITMWALLNIWDIVHAPAPETGRDSLTISRIRDAMGLEVFAFGTILLLVRAIAESRSLSRLAIISILLAISLRPIVPGALQDIVRDGTTREVNEFEDWRRVIPPGNNVYVTRSRKSAAFAWFTLERPSYSTADQSAGAVFSRLTTMEFVRRSKVLLPLSDPDWRLVTNDSIAKNKEKSKLKNSADDPDQSLARPLTKEILVSVCRDPALNFVVAKEKVGFQPFVHKKAGNWTGWNLYACTDVNSRNDGA